MNASDANLADATSPAIGHNKPPAAAEQITDRLAETWPDMVKRQAELLTAFMRTPSIVDDSNAGRVTDFCKQIAASMKAITSARVAEKEPFLDGGRTVDTFFNRLRDPLDEAKGTLQARLTIYERAKADKERRAREEAARIERQEAQRLQAIADERERAAEERERAANTDSDLDDAIEADAVARQADADARQADADAIAAERAANARAAELHTTRGDYGSSSSLRTFWDFADLDRADLDLEALRQHIPLDGLEKAVRSYTKSGGRELRGVRIFKNTKSVVR